MSTILKEMEQAKRNEKIIEAQRDMGIQRTGTIHHLVKIMTKCQDVYQISDQHVFRSL